jgi:3-oxoacyl-[acyl-carrier-protein] synthase II
VQAAVITGVGAVTPVGASFTESWDALLAQKSGVREIDLVHTEDLKVRIGGQAKLRDADTSRKIPRSHLFAVSAVQQAMHQAGLDKFPEGCSLVVGHHGTTREEANLISEAIDVSPGGLAISLRNAFGPIGFCHTVTTACSSGAVAMGLGLEMIRTEQCDLVLVGGTDAVISRATLHSFYEIGALSDRNETPTTALRPFDRTRSGFVLAEGACFFVLERETKESRSRAIGRLMGWAVTTSTDSVAASCADGEVQAKTMNLAIADAGLDPGAIGYVNAHGSGTPDNDVAESRGIVRAVGSDTWVSSSKGSTGHMIGAAGTIEAGFALQAIRSGTLPATVNLENVDPACEVRHVIGSPRTEKIRFAVSNSFGLAGSCAAVVLGGI